MSEEKYRDIKNIMDIPTSEERIEFIEKAIEGDPFYQWERKTPIPLG
jgi:hypothetical protein